MLYRRKWGRERSEKKRRKGKVRRKERDRRDGRKGLRKNATKKYL